MLQTKIINKESCAVSYEPTEIMIRKRGKAFFGTAKYLAKIKDEKLYISEDVAKEFGIEICIEKSKHTEVDKNIRNNLLVTMATRAAYMECKGIIELHPGVNGEEELSEFIAYKVDNYINEDMFENECFDFYIENALKEKYGI